MPLFDFGRTEREEKIRRKAEREGRREGRREGAERYREEAAKVNGNDDHLPPVESVDYR